MAPPAHSTVLNQPKIASCPLDDKFPGDVVPRDIPTRVMHFAVWTAALSGSLSRRRKDRLRGRCIDCSSMTVRDSAISGGWRDSLQRGHLGDVVRHAMAIYRQVTAVNL